MISSADRQRPCHSSVDPSHEVPPTSRNDYSGAVCSPVWPEANASLTTRPSSHSPPLNNAAARPPGRSTSHVKVLTEVQSEIRPGYADFRLYLRGWRWCSGPVHHDLLRGRDAPEVYPGDVCKLRSRADLLPRIKSQTKKTAHRSNHKKYTTSTSLRSKDWDVVAVAREVWTGTERHRPELDAMLDLLQAGDTFAAYALDRFSRDQIRDTAIRSTHWRTPAHR